MKSGFKTVVSYYMYILKNGLNIIISNKLVRTLVFYCRELKQNDNQKTFGRKVNTVSRVTSITMLY